MILRGRRRWRVGSTPAARTAASPRRSPHRAAAAAAAAAAARTVGRRTCPRPRPCRLSSATAARRCVPPSTTLASRHPPWSTRRTEGTRHRGRTSLRIRVHWPRWSPSLPHRQQQPQEQEQEQVRRPLRRPPRRFSAMCPSGPQPAAHTAHMIATDGVRRFVCSCSSYAVHFVLCGGEETGRASSSRHSQRLRWPSSGNL